MVLKLVCHVCDSLGTLSVTSVTASEPCLSCLWRIQPCLSRSVMLESHVCHGLWRGKSRFMEGDRGSNADLHYSERKKGGLQNPSKRFCRFLKASKCVQSLKKGIKNSTEPFEGSVFYPVTEPFLTEPFFGFCTAKKGSVGKYETFGVQYKTITFGTKP